MKVFALQQVALLEPGTRALQCVSMFGFVVVSRTGGQYNR
ncbi:Uncharacterised protein [Mycobacteroides abscessus subsp. abscessus]|nr:Uncharacterised protein [Mycobacteroides abscessus subsp. abscessus]